MRSGSEVGEDTFTPPTPVLYVACLFTNHIMQTNGPSSMSVWNLASWFLQWLCTYMVLYGICLRYLPELPTVFHQPRLTLFTLMILTDCYSLALLFAFCSVELLLEIFTAVITILMCRVLIVNTHKSIQSIM